VWFGNKKYISKDYYKCRMNKAGRLDAVSVAILIIIVLLVIWFIIRVGA